MKTTRYMATSIALIGLIAAGEAQARSSLSIHIGARPPVVTGHHAPRRPPIFVPLHRPQTIRHIVVPPIRPVYVPRPAPVIVTPPVPIVVPAPTVTVWITNANGSRSPVVLKIDGPWYIGPRGERYASLPTEDQLRPLYGLDCGPAQTGQVTVYVTTDSGALRSVTLTQTPSGWRGPNGEVYSEMPTDEQLRMAYGR